MCRLPQRGGPTENVTKLTDRRQNTSVTFAIEIVTQTSASTDTDADDPAKQTRMHPMVDHPTDGGLRQCPGYYFLFIGQVLYWSIVYYEFSFVFNPVFVIACLLVLTKTNLDKNL